MKRTFLFTPVLFLSIFVYSQTIIEKPKVGMSTAPYVKLEKVELCDTATVLWFHINFTPGNWISIPGGTYIQPVGSKEKLFIVSTAGIPMNERVTIPESGELSYKLLFPKIDDSVSTLDYGEANEGGSWFIYDINLKPELFESIIPEQLSGSWFRKDNAQWDISLFDSVAVYKNQVWKYSQYSKKNGLGKISLKNGKKNLEIYVKLLNDSTCMLGETGSLLVKYSNQPDESVIPVDQSLYKSPVFKVDTVTYCGYIRNFSPRYQKRTGMVYVDDILTGEQVPYLMKIEDDGSFVVKFPHCNPQGVFVKSPFSFETVFVEPGGTTFQLIDNSNRTNPVLFMGDCARINLDLLKLKDIYGFNYQEMQQKILDFSPEQYKAWCQEIQQEDLNSLADYVQNHPVSAKAQQVKKLENAYRYAVLMMGYNMNIVSAWRTKNKIPRDQRQIDFQPVKPDSSYYDFLTNDFVNDPMAVLTPEYWSFINHLMFMDILSGPSKGLSTLDIIESLEKSGYKLKPEEKELADRMKEFETPEIKKIQEEYQSRYNDQMIAFQQKYGDKLKPFYKEKEGELVPIAMVEAYLIGQNVEFTEEEKVFLSALKEYFDNPLIKKRETIQSEIAEAVIQFHKDHRTIINALSQRNRIGARNEKMQSILGVQPGLATDIMLSQDYCRSIVSEMTPVSDEKMKDIRQEINNPFIASYIELMNNSIKAKIIASKNQPRATVNEVPKTEGDKIFDAIMKKYKGKVVYVDFWATWCGPCRAGIEHIKPLKDELANEDVVFVYITNQTSPKTTYDNMIAGIKGEHYRVSADEWNILSAKFNISGIPHCTLVGKNGNVINPHLGYLENSQLKELLMKHVNE